MIVDRASLVGAGQSHHHHGAHLGFYFEVSNNVLHEWLIDQLGSECLPLHEIPSCLRHRLTHERHRPVGHVETGCVHHFDDDLNSSTFFADEPSGGIGELKFRRCIRAISHFVFQPHEEKRVSTAVVEHSRHQETRDASGSLSEHQKRIAHRC